MTIKGDSALRKSRVPTPSDGSETRIEDDASDFMTAARVRARAVRPGFTRWIDDLPLWPEGEPEVIGPRRVKKNDEG